MAALLGWSQPARWTCPTLAGRGVFAAWDEPGCFERVHIAPHRAIAWSDELELCPDALYMDLTGKSLDELPTDAEAPVNDA